MTIRNAARSGFASSLLAAVAFATPSAHAATNLVLNPGFEQGAWQSNLVGGAFTVRTTVYIYEPTEHTLYVSQFGFSNVSQFAGWMGCVRSTGCSATGSHASLIPTLAGTVEGQSCLLKFSLGAAYGSSDAGTGTVQVYWNGKRVGAKGYAATVDSLAGSAYRVSKIVATGSDRLEFRLVSGTLAGLDNVSLTCKAAL